MKTLIQAGYQGGWKSASFEMLLKSAGKPLSFLFVSHLLIQSMYFPTASASVVVFVVSLLGNKQFLQKLDPCIIF